MALPQRCTALLFLAGLLCLTSELESQRISVVNLIPNARSNETVNDAEPNIAVNPANLHQIAVSAFTPNPAGGANAPIYVTNDGGRNWNLNAIVPGNSVNYGTGDITLAFGGRSGVLYAAILNGNVQLQLNILRTANFLAPAAMVTLVNRNQDDQPYVEAVTDAIDVPRDRVYVSSNDISQRGNGRTASVDASLDAALAAAPAGFNTLRIETRASAVIGPGLSQDGPSVRTAIHPDGTVYAAFFGWRVFSNPGNTNTTDLVVVRDDNWAAGANPFSSLLDADGLAGMRIVQRVRVPSLGTLLGRQRIGSSLSIATDPRSSDTVFIAWADGTTANNYTIRVRRSTDRGRTWSATLDSAVAATNPSLAINEDGTVALLYQQLESARWKTRLKLTDNAFQSSRTFVLAEFADVTCPAPCGAGPLGDYAEVMAVERNFYGVFSGWNVPDRDNFPAGVVYSRNADFAARRLLQLDNVTPVAASTDPFFFTVEPEATSFQYAAKIICGTQMDPTDLRLGRGIYATTVNIANPNRSPSRLIKSLALSIPPGGEQPGQVLPIEAPLLGPGQSIAADCNEIANRLFAGVLPASYIEGTLFVDSPQEISVTGVYTVAPDATTGTSSIAVEQFDGRRTDPILASPEPVVLRTGTFVLAHLNVVNLDLDDIQTSGTDLIGSWSGSDVTMSPRNGALLHVAGTHALGKYGCQAAQKSAQDVTLDYVKVPNGTAFCMQTDLGRIAELRMVSSAGTRLNFEYTVWQALP